MSAFPSGRRMYELMVGYRPTAESDPPATPAMHAVRDRRASCRAHARAAAFRIPAVMPG